ncbi:MAG: carbohydrate binding domain-containing protein [Pyrinomonadaceae bacterium]
MKKIKFQSRVVRIAALLGSAGVVIFFCQVFIWTAANSAAGGADRKEVGDLLVKLSPSDPQTHLAAAVLHERTFEPGDQEIALKEYELAAALSPYNYLMWIRFGSARGRAGDSVGAESALRRTIDLAPNYARVHWGLGNLLLRENREDEAYDHIRKAVNTDPSLAAAAASIALQLSDGNVNAVKERFAGMPEVGIRLVLILTEQKQYGDAMDVWRSIKLPTMSPNFLESAKEFEHKLFDGKQYRLATEVGEVISADSGKNSIGKISNQGFELPVRAQNSGHFDWKVPLSNFPQFAVTDVVRRDGRFSLSALLNSSDGGNFQGITQMIAVEPGRAYKLSGYYRSDVRSKAEYFWEVVSGMDLKQLAVSKSLIPTSEWTEFGAKFRVPNDADGIQIRFVRGSCTGSACSAAGSFWFDDFDISVSVDK